MYSQTSSDSIPKIPSRGTAHKLRLWVPFTASRLRRPLTSNVERQQVMATISAQGRK
jgi:hypothetical protein